MSPKSIKIIGPLAVAGLALAFSTGSHADTWHGDWWDTNEKAIFKEIDLPEKCVAIFDPITVGSPKLGDFCYDAHGTQRVRDNHGRTTIKFQGTGKAILWEDGASKLNKLATTFYELKSKTVFLTTDTIKSYRMNFDSKPFNVSMGGQCFRISVEMNFTGRNQIGGTVADPIFDITQGADEIVVTPCNHSNHGSDD